MFGFGFDTEIEASYEKECMLIVVIHRVTRSTVSSSAFSITHIGSAWCDAF